MLSNLTLVDQVLVLDPRKAAPAREITEAVPASAVTRRWPLPGAVIYSPQDFNSNGGCQSLTFPLHEALSSSEIDPIQAPDWIWQPRAAHNGTFWAMVEREDSSGRFAGAWSRTPWMGDFRGIVGRSSLAGGGIMAGVVHTDGTLVAYLSPHKLVNHAIVRTTSDDANGWPSFKRAKNEVELLMHGYMEGRYRAAVWVRGQPVEVMYLSGRSYIAQQDKEGLILS